jgi:hypothetical protein
MVLAAMIGLALGLTLLLPIYPDSLEPLVLVFLALVGSAGLLALAHRSARRELMVLSLWAIAVAVGMFVGSVRYADAQQILEDTLPYSLFVLGVLAGRASPRPRRVLVLVLLVCLGDSIVSLVKMMPHYTPGFRSSYTYTRIVAGLPLLGMFVLVFLRRLDRDSGTVRSLPRSPLAVGLYAVMLVAMLASVSRGMMLGWVAGIATIAYLRSPSRGLFLTLLVTLGFVGYSSVFADIGVRYLRAGEGATIAGRFEEIRSAMEVFAQYPLFGSGLGSSVEANGTYHSYVHNMIAYHLWKFGLVGSAMLVLPLFVVGAQVRRYPRPLRAAALGGATAVFAYLVTCAVYKTYYLVWMYGLTAGAVLTVLWQWEQKQRAALSDGATLRAP